MRRITLLLPLAVLAGCGEKFIPNTQVEDSEENRATIAFCEQYRVALEAMDIPRLMLLASESYFEEGDPSDGSDDYSYTGLEQALRLRFARLEAIRYDILYRRVAFLPDRVEVFYTFHGRYQVRSAGEGNSTWHSRVADNRLVLERTEDGYRILGGM